MPASPRVLVLSATAAPGSPNTALALEIARRLAVAGCDSSVATLSDYPLAVLDAEDSRVGSVPREAAQLAERLALQDALVLVAPLVNGSLAPLAKNAMDWIERAGRGRADRDAPFRGLLVALAAAEAVSANETALAEAWRPVIAALRAEAVEGTLVLPGSALASLNEATAEAIESFAETVAARARTDGRRVY